MPLTSMRFLVLCIVLAIAIPLALVILWRQAPQKSRRTIPLFLVGVLLAQATAISAVAVSVNRDYGFYPDWASLWGTPAAPPVVQAGTRLGVNGVRTRRPVLPLASGPASDIGRYERITLRGTQSGITDTVMAWLPPQYFDRRYAETRFSVVMVLGGGAGKQIPFIVDRLGFAAAASGEIHGGRVTPFVAVFAETSVALPLWTECTDFPGGPQAFTWLNQDVRNWATSTLRVTSDARRWSVMGWSTGGYCAAKLHLGQPARFGAAASIQGYFKPEPDTNTGNLAQLLSRHPTLAHESSPTWLIENHPPSRVHLLVMSSDTDPQSYPQALEFLHRERNVPGVQPYLVQDLGHNIGAYKAVLVPVLDWLAAVADA